MINWILGGVATAGSIIGGIEANKASAEQEKRNQEEALYRYRVQSKIAMEQMLEQDIEALSQMTDLTRQFLSVKSKTIASQAESGVTGKSAQRVRNTLDLKLSEEKGKVAKEANLNKVNIANDMLGKKIDTEANMARAINQRKSVFGIISDGISTGTQAYNLGSNIESSDWWKKNILGQ